MGVTRSNPFILDTSRKEAVADSLLNIVYSRISGGGDYGKIIYGTKPSSALVSGFLLPRRQIDDGDEVTSPIWISSHGLDLQITRDGQGVIRVQPNFSLYVRILPTEDDIKTREDCRLQFRLKKEVSQGLRQRIKAALDAKWDEIKGNYASRRECPDWKRIKDEVHAKVYQDSGIPSNLDEVINAPEEEESVADNTPNDDANAGPTDALVVKDAPPPGLNDEHFEALNIPHKWLRLDLALPPFALNPYAPDSERLEQMKAHESAMEAAIRDRILAWLDDEDPKTGGKLWAYRAGVSIKPSQYKNWDQFLKELRDRGGNPTVPIHRVAWDIEMSVDWMNPSRLNVHLALENQSDEPLQHKDETDVAVFGVSIDLQLPKQMHQRLRLERVKPSYRYNRYLNYPAIGYNGGVRERHSEHGEVLLRTTWAPRYYQPRIVPISYPGVVRNIRKLSQPDSLSGLEPIPGAFESWLSTVQAKVGLDVGIEGDKDAIDREQQKFNEDLAKWKIEKDAIAAGVALLSESKQHWQKRGPQADLRAAPFEAWLAMNEAMADLMRLRTKDDSGEWRLFQLAFILANLPAIATRMKEFSHLYNESRDDAVTLLYFATGGGKSEAFFGLLLFTLFLDRLRGKSFGVSSMIRYPLRLLTIQQAQRAAKVLAQAELVRQKYGYIGQPFSIGFWVGSGGSPNRLNAKGMSDVPEIQKVTDTEDKLREADAKYAAAVKSWNKLPSCPFCGGQTGLRLFPKLGGTLAHVCTNAKCDWNKAEVKPLPFYICDEDIYDLAPSVLLGTVDKLALIGHAASTIRSVMGMLGTAPWRETETGRLHIPDSKAIKDGPEHHGCVPLFPAYSSGEKIFHDPFPALLIQDEAHLLDESLGTFSGLFESTLDAMLEGLTRWMKDVVSTDPNGNRRRAKVIAASATVSEPERQLEHLYQRKIPALQFPHPGPDIYSSFYATPQEPQDDEPTRLVLPGTEVESRARLARIYCGFMTNGRPHTTTTVNLLANFHLSITDLFTKLAFGDEATQASARQQLCDHLSESPIRAVLDEKLKSAPVSDLATLVDLHRISLTYVTNKKGGDQIMAAESEEVRKLHKAHGYQLDALHTRLITGSIDQGEIQDTVQTAQKRVPHGEELPPLTDALRSIVATSAVSHGVDVEELNSMFFAGMPSDIAEYIQASSRIGRTHVGFCVLCPTPQRRRDRYIIEVFDIFHRFLERMVQPAAIDRWAEKAVQRVIPSVFQAGLCGVAATRDFLRLEDDKKTTWKANAEIRDFLPDYQRNALQFIDQISNFVFLAIGLKDGYAPQGEDYYKAEVKKRIRRMVEEMAEQQNKNSSLRTYFEQNTDSLLKPMTSLRDVDQAGLIRLASKDVDGSKLSDEDVRDVMAFVRQGYAEAGDEE